MVGAQTGLLLLFRKVLPLSRSTRDVLLLFFLVLGLEILELSSSVTEAQDLVRAPTGLLLLLLNALGKGWFFTRPPRDLLLSFFLHLGLDILEFSSLAVEAQDLVSAPADLLLLLLNTSEEGWLVTRPPRDLLLSCFLNLGLDVIEVSSSASDAQDLIRALADLLLLLLDTSGKGWVFTRPPRDLLLSFFLDLGLDILELSLSEIEAQDLARAPAGLVLLLFRTTLPSSRPTRDLLLSYFLNLGMGVIELSPSATEAKEMVNAPADLLLLLLNASVEGWLFTRPPRDLLHSCFLHLGLEVVEILSSSTEAQDLVRALADLLLLF